MRRGKHPSSWLRGEETTPSLWHSLRESPPLFITKSISTSCLYIYLLTLFNQVTHWEHSLFSNNDPRAIICVSDDCYKTENGQPNQITNTYLPTSFPYSSPFPQRSPLVGVWCVWADSTRVLRFCPGSDCLSLTFLGGPESSVLGNILVLREKLMDHNILRQVRSGPVFRE